MVLAINTIGACMCMHLCWARGHDVCTSNEFLFQLQEIGCIQLALPVVCASVSVCVCALCTSMYAHVLKGLKIQLYLMLSKL